MTFNLWSMSLTQWRRNKLARLRVLAGLVESLPSNHSVTFSDGEILSRT